MHSKKFLIATATLIYGGFSCLHRINESSSTKQSPPHSKQERILRMVQPDDDLIDKDEITTPADIQVREAKICYFFPYFDNYYGSRKPHSEGLKGTFFQDDKNLNYLAVMKRVPGKSCRLLKDSESELLVIWSYAERESCETDSGCMGFAADNNGHQYKIMMHRFGGSRFQFSLQENVENADSDNAGPTVDFKPANEIQLDVLGGEHLGIKSSYYGIDFSEGYKYTTFAGIEKISQYHGQFQPIHISDPGDFGWWLDFTPEISLFKYKLNEEDPTEGITEEQRWSEKINKPRSEYKASMEAIQQGLKIDGFTAEKSTDLYLRFAAVYYGFIYEKNPKEWKDKVTTDNFFTSFHDIKSVFDTAGVQYDIKIDYRYSHKW